MVRPPKPNDIKENIPIRRSVIKSLKPDLEERYRTEARLPKNILSDKTKNLSQSVGTSLQAKVKAKNASVSQKPKPTSPKTKVSKTMSQQPTSSVNKQDSTSPRKTFTNKPVSPTGQKKTRKPSASKKKGPTEAKAETVMNRLLKIPEAEDPDRTSLPIGEQFTTIDGKIKTSSRLSKIGKIVSGTKKGHKKTSIKKSLNDSGKVLDFSLKQEESVASLTTHFRMPYGELKTVPNASTKFVNTVKKRKTSTVQKKVSKDKAEQEDTPKEPKNKRKSKLQSSTLIDRVLSSDSVPVFSLREIKHNDSFVISARKLQKSSSERRGRKSRCLKLNQRTSSVARINRNHLPLKSCLKKTWEDVYKIEEHFKSEGKMRLHETFFPTKIL